MKVRTFTLSLITAAALWAQPPQGPAMRGRGPGGMESRISQRLGLNATQQNALHTALEEERTQTQGIGEQIRNLHQNLVNAIKSGNSDQIDSVTQQLSSLDQQRNAIHAKSIMKVYSTLTADQKTKAGTNLEFLLGPGPFGRGMGPRPRPGTAPQQQ